MPATYESMEALRRKLLEIKSQKRSPMQDYAEQKIHNRMQINWPAFIVFVFVLSEIMLIAVLGWMWLH